VLILALFLSNDYPPSLHKHVLSVAEWKGVRGSFSLLIEGKISSLRNVLAFPLLSRRGWGGVCSIKTR